MRLDSMVDGLFARLMYGRELGLDGVRDQANNGLYSVFSSRE